MDKYVLEEMIGEGTFGIIYKAKEKASNDLVAIKKFKTVDEVAIKREIQTCSMLNHPNIVSYRTSFRYDGVFYLVFDYVCEDLVQLLSKHKSGVSPQKAQLIIFQLCKALEYCHSNRVIHRDVKPDNILLDRNGTIKLCDFGIARTVHFDGDPLSDYVSTRWYRPPEQELRLGRYSFNADIWSVGCVLMELLTGRPLFPGNTQIEQLNLIQRYLGPLPLALYPKVPRGVVSYPAPCHCFQDLLGARCLPVGALDFLTDTLQLDPRLRLTAKECLNHPFLRPLRDAELEDWEKRRQSGQFSRSSDEECIKEEITGEEQSLCREHQQELKADQKVDNQLYKSCSVSTSEDDTAHILAPRHDVNDPSNECDSDNILEIIETDETRLQSSHGDEWKSNKNVREQELHRLLRSRDTIRVLASVKSCGDPLDGDSCYEDDFEEEQSH